MIKRARFFAIVLLTVLFSISLSYAQSPQITKGLNYLFSSQNSDGSWTGTLNRGTFSTTVNVMETLSLLGQGNTPVYSNAVSWMQAQNLAITEQLSDRINILADAGTDGNLLVSYYDSETGAWGGYDGYEVNNVDTVLAIRALKKINYQDQTIINSAVNNLLTAQNTDGGWGLKQGMDSELYYTTFISTVLQQLPQTPPISAALQRAIVYRNANKDAGRT